MMESGETLLNNHWLGNRGGSLSFLVGTISNVLVVEIGWTDVGSRGYILVSCAHSNASSFLKNTFIHLEPEMLFLDFLCLSIHD